LLLIPDYQFVNDSEKEHGGLLLKNFDEFLGVHLEIMSKLLQSNRENGWNEGTTLFRPFFKKLAFLYNIEFFI